MSNYEILGLYPHNIKSYEKIKDAFREQDVVAIVHSTGTGKSYNALQLILDNPDKKVLYMVPYNSIIEHLKEIIALNPNVDLNREFKNVQFKTYHGLTRLSQEELDNLTTDILILDEFHHIGAPIWGSCVNRIIEKNENIKILGLTAYPVRGRGTVFERDMICEDGDELFSNKVVSKYDLADAICDGILPKPIYRSAFISFKENITEIEKKLSRIPCGFDEYNKLSDLLSEVKKRIHEASGMKEVFKQNVRSDGKYIYFCPLKCNINEIIEETKSWLKEKELEESDYVIYSTTHEMGTYGKNNRRAFYYDKNLNGEDVSNKLRIMFAINQYNEGVHAPGIDGVIMGRETSSEIVYYEQLGRGLSTKPGIIENYNILKDKSDEELIELCKKRKISVENKTKEELIELLIYPVIIDLADNIDYIKQLEISLCHKINEIKNNNKNDSKKNGYINSIIPYFDIGLLNKDIYEIVKYIKKRLSLNWDNYYYMAKQYFEYNKNLYIPRSFKTFDGVEYDKNGYSLGKWLYEQKRSYQDLTILSDRVEKLDDLFIDWNMEFDAPVDRHFQMELEYCAKNNIDYNDLKKGITIDYFGKFWKGRFPLKLVHGCPFAAMNVEPYNYDDEVPSDINVEDDVITNVYSKELHDYLNQNLNMRQHDMIYKYFGLHDEIPRTFEDIGKEYNITASGAREVVGKGIRKLRNPRHIKSLQDEPEQRFLK